MSNLDVHPSINALSKPAVQGEVTAGLMNTTPHPIFIPAGTLYGKAIATCDPQHQDRFPWRLSTIDKHNLPKYSTVTTDTTSLPRFFKGPLTDKNNLMMINYLISR